MIRFCGVAGALGYTASRSHVMMQGDSLKTKEERSTSRPALPGIIELVIKGQLF